MDRFEAMSLLVEVVDSGSFSAAGRRLHMPVTTIARKISDLENLLGARLLIRTTRRLSLTDAGNAYLVAARRIVDQVDEAERAVAGEFSVPKGELVLTAPVQFGQLHVLPVVADFLAEFPQINIRLLLLDRNIHLVEDHVDMAVRIGSRADSSMIATRIGSMRSVICASPKLLELHGTPQNAEELQKLPLIAFDGPTPTPGWGLVDPQTKLSFQVPFTPRLAVTTAEAAVRAASMHVGATRLLHYQVADAVKAKKLRLILETFEPEPFPVSLVHVGRGQMPIKMRSFMDFALPRLRRSLQEFGR